MNMNKVVEDDPVAIINNAVVELQIALNEKLSEGDSRRIVMEVASGLIATANMSINAQSKRRFLANMIGDELDAYGEPLGVPRLKEQPAIVPCRFVLPSMRAVESVIPTGTRATSDGKVFFKTTKVLSIPAGQLFVDAVLECTVAGNVGNEYVTGAVKTISDGLEFAASVINTDKSSGGADKELDDDYRERIQLAPGRFSAVGSEDAYKFFAFSADANVTDVIVDSPSECVTRIIPLMKGGVIPTQTEIDRIKAVVTLPKNKAHTDRVDVVAPTESTYTVVATYYISKDSAGEESTRKTAITEAVAEYNLWQRSALNRAINPDELKYLVKKAGAHRIDITSPVYTPVTGAKYARCTSVTLTYGGLL